MGFLDPAVEERQRISESAFLLAATAAFALCVVSRRPDAFTNPQFYVEDGLWYADAHEWGGLTALLTPYRGYFVTAQRLAGWVAQAVPFAAAPLVLNSLALVIQILPALVMCSSRFAHIVPNRRIRLLLALLYVAVPNSWGTISNITHAQWHLANLACLTLVARSAEGVPWRIFDVVSLVLAGLSGPFAIFLAPIAALVWWRDRSRWRLALLIIVATTALVQLVVLVFVGARHQGHRPVLGASVARFFSLWTKQVVYGAFIGQRGLEWLYRTGTSMWLGPMLLIVFGCVALGVLIFAAIRGPFELRMIVLMAGCIFGAALVWPPDGAIPLTYWESISAPGAGNRYFILPIFALGMSFARLLEEERLAMRALGGLALVGIVVGSTLDWKQPALRDFDFARYVRKYESATPGEKVQIPYPTNWGIVLTKKDATSGSARSNTPDPSTPKPDRPGTFDASTMMFYLGPKEGNEVKPFQFGAPGMNAIPLIGDWDGDGFDTVGLYLRDNALFYLASADEAPVARDTFFFGVPGLLPVVGDWDGDGQDTIGVYVPATANFFLSNINAAGSVAISFTFAAPKLWPLSGDWDGDGRDTVGVYVPDTGTFFLAEKNVAGTAAATFSFGPRNKVPIVGDWDGDGKDTVGIYDPADGTFRLTNVNGRNASITTIVGVPRRTPLVGHWK